MERGISMVLEKFGNDWSQQYHPTSHVSKVLCHIRDCRTEAMGGRLMVCPECGHIHDAWNSCRNRHCPNCQSAPREAWLASRKEELIPVTYFHVVFTLPDCLNGIILGNMYEAYSALFCAAKNTLSAFGQKQGLQLGITALLHTWGSNLSFHPHLHCIVPGGGYCFNTGHWKNLPQVKDGKDSEPFLFPVRALSSMFRAKWMDAFTSEVAVPETIRAQCFAKAWVVYAKSPVCGVEKTLDYIARYAYRVAISNNRVKSVGDGGVTFEYKDYRDGGANKEMTLSGVEFIRRYAMHILPKRFVRIRHFGFLAPGNRAKLAEMQEELGTIPVPKQRKRKTWQDICTAKGIVMNLCPKCGIGILEAYSLFPRIRSPGFNLAL